MKTLIIAEAGVNHNGDIELAKKLIDVAADAGADLVKFQTFSADRLVTQSALKAEYQALVTDKIESQHEMLRKLELTESMHHELINHCANREIGFFSTGFDIESINFLASLGQELFKIPSGEITNLPFLQHIGGLGKKVLLSTGMSNMHEVAAALNALELAGTHKNRITVLHCTSAYPAEISDVNLRAMLSIQDEFGVEVGYSDHTLGIEVAIAAVALGAKVIEKHFTLDRNMTGPDHKASLEPDELIRMVVGIRSIEKALGDGNKVITQNEIQNRDVARKSIVASRDIEAGEVFTENNLTAKRPGTGISPMKWDEVIGTKAKQSYVKDDLIQL
jgi:N,N'-diacetyllegionaminate synthase